MAVDQVKRQFELVDDNKDGVISRAELAKTLKQLDKLVWTDPNVDALIAALDTNRDGKIQYKEFLDYVFENTDGNEPALFFTSSEEASIQAGQQKGAESSESIVQVVEAAKENQAKVEPAQQPAPEPPDMANRPKVGDKVRMPNGEKGILVADDWKGEMKGHHISAPFQVDVEEDDGDSCRTTHYWYARCHSYDSDYKPRPADESSIQCAERSA